MLAEYRDWRRFPCPGCGDEVVTQDTRQVYCHPICRTNAQKRRWYARRRDDLLPRLRAAYARTRGAA
jgi:hypothetical protein